MTTNQTTRTLIAPGATITYDVRPGDPDNTTLFLIGSPMGAAGFESLASHFTDRTLITYDPRGSERSTLDEPTKPPTPAEHAADLHRIIDEVGGPVDMFASSGGAVNALALAAAHPGDLSTMVAHEPPLPAILPDRESALAAARAVAETYQKGGLGPGMAHFIVVSTHRGEFTPEVVNAPPPDPATFGLPTDDDGSRTDPLLGLGMVGSIGYEPDFDALAAATCRIVLAAGVESEGEMPSRSAHSVAERLGVDPVIFPSHHGGFLGGEYGQEGDPDAFAAKLKEVLAGE